MGRPSHYSREIATRCQRLIEELAPRIPDEPSLAEEWGGPLLTTFLLAMSTPMVLLPLERVFKPFVLAKTGVADDSTLDAELSQRVAEVFGDNRTFGTAPFFEPGAWSYIEAVRHFAVSDAWPADILKQLGSRDALAAAADESTATILLTLRNALGHGGVTYLDRSGRHSESATHMLGFASYPSLKRTDELRLLRIPVEAYQRFLGLWSCWLAASGVQTALDQEGPGWFAEEQAASRAGG